MRFHLLFFLLLIFFKKQNLFLNPILLSGSICFDLSLYKTLATIIARTLEPGMEKLDDNAASVDAKVKDVDRACKQVKFFKFK